MNKPWDLKTEEERLIDNIYTFLIFCEDETSEIEYFKWFETNDIKINVIPKQRSMITNVIKAITHCKNSGIIDGENNVVDGYEVWCVYDRDKDLNSSGLLENNNNFNVAHFVAENHKINLAWSNDAFELWILLHLMEIDVKDEDFKIRENYYNILDSFFKSHQNPNERLVKILGYPTFSYKKDLKHRKNFIEIVREEILPHTQKAITNAEKMLRYHKEQTQNYDEWAPCTLVHLLVVRLLEKGKKELPVN